MNLFSISLNIITPLKLKA